MEGCGGWGSTLLCSERMQQFIVAAPEVVLKPEQGPASPGVQPRHAQPLHSNALAIPYDSHIHWSLVRPVPQLAQCVCRPLATGARITDQTIMARRPGSCPTSIMVSMASVADSLHGLQRLPAMCWHVGSATLLRGPCLRGAPAQGSSRLRVMPNRETVRLDKSLLAAQSFRSRHTFRRRLRELCLGAPQLCRHAEVQAAKSNATEVLQVGRLLA